ncbi:hypothetical protein OH491_13615 [Termitidicoccus mucosus]
MNEPGPWTLFEMLVRVRPSPRHPQYWNFEWGILHIVLYAPSGEDAAGRAAAITGQLPYETASPRVRFREVPSAPEPRLLQAVEDARHLGVGIFLIGAPTGSDEIEGFDERDS